MHKVVKSALVSLAIVVMLAGLLLILIEHNIRPILLSMAEARVRAIALDAINKAALQSFKDVSYGELIAMTYADDNQVSSLSANVTMMNILSSECAMTAQQYITDIDMQPIRVSLGSATGIQLLLGRGPSVLVKVEPVGAVKSAFHTQFSAAGINQTRHRIYMNVTATVRIIIPTGSAPMEVSSQVLVAETIIVGKVPQSFVNVEQIDDMLNLIPNEMPLE